MLLTVIYSHVVLEDSKPQQNSGLFYTTFILLILRFYTANTAIAFLLILLKLLYLLQILCLA